VTGGDVNRDLEPCIAVVGMHRSGTSATAGLLIGLGLAGPREDDLVAGDSSNERGHWESHEVQLCNARLLAAVGATTYAPPPFTEDWSAVADYESVKARAESWFSATYAGVPIVMKDPRLCLTMPFWRTTVPAPMGAILVLRDPMHVARSLQARDGVPILLGLALWDRYIRSASHGLSGLPTIVVEYNSMIEDRADATRAVTQFLEQMGVHPKAGASDDPALSLDPGLRHQSDRNFQYGDLDSVQREVLEVLTERLGPHASWQPPDLPPPPAWVDDALRLRRDYARAARELHWIRASRTYKMASSLWRLTGRGPTTLGQAGPEEENVL
jgi:hypothetical protein